MSSESARAFIERVRTDQEFAKQVEQFTDSAALLAFAQAEGFAVSLAEINHAGSVLSDGELAEIAGGSNPACKYNGGVLQYCDRYRAALAGPTI